MRCQETKQYIYSYIDGYLTESQEKTLYQHLSLCPSCQNEMNVARRVNELLEENCTTVEPPANFTRMVMQQIPGAPEVEESPVQKRRNPKNKFSVAGWLSSMLDMETRVLLAASYFVIFIAIGVLFVYGSNQLNALTPAQQGPGQQLSGDILDEEETTKGNEGQKKTDTQEGIKQSNNTDPNVVVPSPAKPDPDDRDDRLSITDDIDVETVSPTVILTPMITDNRLNNIHPAWDKDGNIVYLSQRRAGEERYAVWRTSADGKGGKTIAAGQYGLPVMHGGGIWSPDRSEIAYVTDRNGYMEIWVDDLSGRGTNLTIDTTGKAVERAKDSKDFWAYSPVWSSQGEIAYLTTRSGNVDIMAIDINGTNRVVTMTPAVETNPDWSPDGEKLAYFRSMTDEEGETTNQIYVVNKDGSDPRAVVSDFDAASMVPAWHPDGKMLAINAGQMKEGSLENKGIWLVNLDSGTATQLTKIGGGEMVSWSPDGSKVAFTDTNGVLHVLYLKEDLTVDGIYRIMPGSEGETKVWVDWSADSKQMLFDWDKSGSARGVWAATLPVVKKNENPAEANTTRQMFE
ncbi:zf-HC2 domain-containing protein [Metallumcola ferriviriculae]|uniref:Anti-sigma-W factor RsiW n=1 Tax=Metallumcola ferriviriculae TaxID=3039180 RepID=A0AAU0UKM2_9FIRM|nr:zf-HC2 domain-containing protein [Desulfitibacteraceae bacterium MK1]